MYKYFVHHDERRRNSYEVPAYNWVQYWIEFLHILNEKCSSKTHSPSKSLHECLVEETCLLNLLISVLVHDKLGCGKMYKDIFVNFDASMIWCFSNKNEWQVLTSIACPLGSIINGKRTHRSKMTPFSKLSESDGRPCDCHSSLSDALLKDSTMPTMTGGISVSFCRS